MTAQGFFDSPDMSHMLSEIGQKNSEKCDYGLSIKNMYLREDYENL